MRPQAQSADEQTRLTVHKQTIDRYLRYILIRCTAYTNDRTLAERIAVYTLITTCLLSDKLRRIGDLGVVMDTMVHMIGEDQVENLKTGNSNLKTEEDGAPVFLLDDRMCEVAGAINGLNQLERELLVLHHIEGIETAALADIHKMSHTRIEKAIAKAERQLVELLRGMSSWDHEIEPDVHSLLNDFAACLDVHWVQSLGVYVLHYLADHSW